MRTLSLGLALTMPFSIEASTPSLIALSHRTPLRVSFPSQILLGCLSERSFNGICHWRVIWELCCVGLRQLWRWISFCPDKGYVVIVFTFFYCALFETLILWRFGTIPCIDIYCGRFFEALQSKCSFTGPPSVYTRVFNLISYTFFLWGKLEYSTEIYK